MLAPLLLVVSVLLLAVGACGAPAQERQRPGAGSVATGSTPAPTSTSSSALPPSPLADRTTALGSARYDPDEHRARERRPATLSVSAIGVDASIVRAVGVQANGEMEIPPASEVGWYRFGPAPGEGGTTVLAGHIAYDGVDGVFRHLDRLAPGDEVVVGFDDGTSLRYRVTRLASYDKQELPRDLFAAVTPGGGSAAGERLVLITCGGDFNPSLRSYEDNVVAYAAPAG